MSSKPLFLLTNDDGVHAPGLKVLAETARKYGDVVVVAPHVERSASSQAISISVPLRVEIIEDDVYAVEGTPADCVMLALHKILKRKPDWVLSGVNRGANLGLDTLYSGTVGAALEGALQGIPGLAVSCHGDKSAELIYETAGKVVDLVMPVRDEVMPRRGGVLNLNVPSYPFSQLKGIAVAHLGKRLWQEDFAESTDPRGRPYFWIGGSENEFVDIPGSDCNLVNERYATLSFLRPSLLCEEGNSALAGRVTGLFDGHFSSEISS